MACFQMLTMSAVGGSSELHQLRDGSHVVSPDLVGQLPWVGVDAVGCEVPAGTFDIARKQREHVRIVGGIDRLGKVNQDDSPLPVEDIICRQVTVNTTMSQGQLDVAHDAVKERLCFLLWKFD